MLKNIIKHYMRYYCIVFGHVYKALKCNECFALGQVDLVQLLELQLLGYIHTVNFFYSH